MPEYKCSFCGKVCKNPQAKQAHERWCEKNPDSIKKTKSSPEKTPPEKDDKPKTEIPNLSSVGAILQGFGITDGATLMKTIDEKARQMPFYADITNEINQLKEQTNSLNALTVETNEKIDLLISKLQEAQGRAQNQPEKPTATQEQPQTQPATTGATAPTGSLETWFDRGLRLLQVAGGGSGNSSPPPEEKYKGLLELVNVIKAIQGDPVKQFTEGFKVFSDIQKNAINIAKGIPTPKPKIEEHLEE